MNTEHTFFENDEGTIHLIVGGKHEYFFPCPHCTPSYLTYKPVIETKNICYNAKTDRCSFCYEPECELAGCQPEIVCGERSK